ncbi:NUDIX domain-containing protein [Devosia rhodophyticola]|uniref:NUDIX domain-containing protein n=1 Tax=Devosia rhodophyticola TaxID=3026423 RepID=A0ABY7YV47_9HYPH|nr:NUDIX domain-containing protein [Devosia rhodophyticola]WDR05052.1 NUDIX domain-containing protein [Devosia rhodophyticola]
MQMSRFQRVRAKVYLNAMGLWRRMTLGTRTMLVDGDKVLLIRHTYVPGWQFPGGGVEPGETLAGAAARELQEESGYRVIAPTLFGMYHNTSPITDRDHVAFFVSHKFEKAFEFKPSYEIAEVGWFDRAHLPDKVTPATSQRIDEYFDRAPRRDIWGY